MLAAVPRDGSLYVDEFSLPVRGGIDYWDQIYSPLSDLSVKVTAFRNEGRIVAEIAVEVEIEAPCARCLEPARTRLKGALRYIFSLRHEREEDSSGKTNKERDGDEEMILLDSWEDEINLSQIIWETLVTSLPATLLCKQDCLGLCPSCGANLNEGNCSCKKDNSDPRFDVLRKFMEQ